MRNYRKSLLLTVLILLLTFMTGCSDFAGLRKPLYNGNPVDPNEEAIKAYQESGEIVGTEKDFYFRYPFSEAIYNDSLTYTNEEPLLLGEGTYIIGEDIPAGRVSLLGNESVFSSENNAVHVGNMMIRDEEDMVYFENLFHSDYGQLITQVDFIENHTIEIIGNDPQITVFYSEEFPEDPYILMDPPQVLVNLGRLETPQPVIKEGQSIQLTAGIYEVGKHIEAGQYTIQIVRAPHNTEFFRFRAGEEPVVYELLQTTEMENAGELENISYPTIEFEDGDKIYPNLIHTLKLLKVNE